MAESDTASRSRCGWARGDPLLVAYHDREWGTPVHDDRVHYAFLVLEGAQAGLSWTTILRKREAYQRAFAGFDPRKVARFGERDVRRLLADGGIVRNEAKVRSAIANAKAFLAVQEEFGSFDAFVWHFVGGRPKVNRWKTLAEIPATSPESEALSKELRRRGFSFVGPTIAYAHMQAVGLVDDHVAGCFRKREVTARSGGGGSPRSAPRDHGGGGMVTSSTTAEYRSRANRANAR